MFASKNTITTFRSFVPFNELNTARTNQPVPQGAAGAYITLVGGGGSGGNGYGAAFSAGGGGGGGGAVIGRSFIPASSLGSTYSVTVGSAGSSGTNGGSSTFTSGSVSLTAGGGGAGGGGSTTIGGGGGAAGTASVSGATVSSANGAAGGSGSFTGAGSPGTNNTTGGAPGGGGGAFRTNVGGTFAGGAGGSTGYASGGAAGTGGSPGTAAGTGASLSAGLPGGAGGGGGSTSGGFGGEAGGTGGTYGAGGGAAGAGDSVVVGSSGAVGYALVEWVNTPNVVKFDSVGDGGIGAQSTTATCHHIVGTGASILLWVDYAWQNTTGAGTISATVGATPMTLLSNQTYISVSGFTYGLAVYGLQSPPTGLQTITFTSSVTYGTAMNSISYTNVSYFGTPTFTTGSGTSASMSASSSTAHMVSQAFTNNSPSGVTFINYNQSQRYNQSSISASNAPIVAGDAPGASSVNFSSSWTGSLSWIGMAVDMFSV
jgi:hypothetical protein